MTVENMQHLGLGAVIVVAAIAVIGLMIWRRMRPQLVTPKKLLVLPVVLAGVALLADHGLATRMAHPAALLLMVGAGVAAVGLGIARGMTMRVQRQGPAIFKAGTRPTMWLWLVTIAVRIAVIGVSFAIGSPEGMGEMLLFLALTLGSESAVLLARSGAWQPQGQPQARPLVEQRR